MSISLEYSLPTEFSAGTITFDPLGGDGIVAPSAAYYLNGVALTGDASGGTATLTINLDRRYECVVGNLTSKASGTGISGSVPTVLTVTPQLCVSINAGAYTSIDDTSRVAWSPDAFFDAQAVQVEWNNLNGATFALDAVVYLFRRGASQRSPLSTLLSSLPRAGSTIPAQ